MKRSSTIGLLTGILICSLSAFSQVQQVKLTSAADMRGVYTILKQVADTGTGEFSMANQQVKIFTDRYVMYAYRRSETDSSAGFGIGTYKVENGKVIENMFHTASGPVNNTYELAINMQKDGYSQVIHFPANDRGIQWLLTEEYAKVGRKMKSPLDGAWRIKKVTIVDKDGKTTTYESSEDAKQFKLFESGNFMWANYLKDKTTGKINTAYGFGTFEMDSPGKITETNSSSTYTTMLVGKPVKLNIKFVGKDMYEQTEEGPNGSKRTEAYERLK